MYLCVCTYGLTICLILEKAHLSRLPMRNTVFGDRKVCLLNVLPNGVTGSRFYFHLKIAAALPLGNH